MKWKLNKSSTGRHPGWYQYAPLFAGLNKPVKFTYKYHKQKAIRHPLNSRVAKRYAAFWTILADIDSVKAFVKQINKLIEFNSGQDVLEENQQILIQGLFIAALTTYGRCFTSSGGRKNTPQANEIFSGDRNALKRHEIIMDLRNAYAAHHHELQGQEFIPVLLTVNKRGKKGHTVTVEYKTIFTDYLNEIHDNCQIIIEKINDILEKTYSKMMQNDPDIIGILYKPTIDILVRKASLTHQDAFEIITEYIKHIPESATGMEMEINGIKDICIFNTHAGKRLQNFYAKWNSEWQFRVESILE